MILTIEKLFKRRSIILRWLYHSSDQELGGFNIQNLYIGYSCPSLCSGHGNCWKGVCSCDSGYFGKKLFIQHYGNFLFKSFVYQILGNDCSGSYKNKPSGVVDTFANRKEANPEYFSFLWKRIINGRRLPNFCDPRRNPPNYVMFFGDGGSNAAITVEINTQHLRYDCIPFNRYCYDY